jgi:hypothetical protein
MKGEVVYLYAFDVANEIETPRVREVLSAKPFPYEIRMDRTLPKDMPLYKPLAIEPPPLAAKLLGQTVRPLIRLYDVGVVTVMVRVPIAAERLGEWASHHRPVLDDGRTLDAVAQEYCREVCRSLESLMIGQAEEVLPPEAYTVFCLTDLDGERDANRWLAAHRREVAGLLAETPAENLSEAQVDEVLRIHRSFENTDLAVIDWDAALVVDLAGYVDDVLYALELANLQLEEFRVMDGRLDRYLEKAYKDLERPKGGGFGRASGSLRRLRRLRMDVTKLADEVTHITKFFGDWHLARVYLGARDRFYLEEWRKSVEKRLAQLDQLYNVVHGEMNEQRMLVLEIIIVVFFAVDLLLLFFGKR